MKRAALIVALAFSGYYSFAQLSQQNQQMAQQVVQALQQQQPQLQQQTQHSNQNQAQPNATPTAVQPVLSPQVQQMLTETVSSLQQQQNEQQQQQQQKQKQQAVPTFQYGFLLSNGDAIQGQSFISMEDALTRAWNTYLHVVGGNKAQGDNVQQDSYGSGAVVRGTQTQYMIQYQSNGIIYQGQSAVSGQQAIDNALNAAVQTINTGFLGTYVGPNGEGTGVSFYNNSNNTLPPSQLPKSKDIVTAPIPIIIH